MGFRSTFTTEDISSIIWPRWFCDKYAGQIRFTSYQTGVLSAAREATTYGVWKDLHEDIQRAIYWEDYKGSFVLVYLHECGGITRCQIEKDSIKWSEPETWRSATGVEHYYCYQCSDV